MKKYLAYDSINSDYEEFETIEQAREYLVEAFLDPDEGYHPDLIDCKIYELKETVEYDVIDKKENYKYMDEDDIPEGSDEEAWGHGDVDEVWKHKFIDIKCDHLPEAGKMIESYPNIGMLRNAFEKETGKPCEVYWEGNIENPAYTCWLEKKLTKNDSQ